VTAEATSPSDNGALAVFRNGGFLRLWLSQAATQIGGNMVLYGLTVIVVESTGSKTAVSLLILTFLVPAVLFSAVAGVYVDRFERRTILVATNILRGLAFVALYFVGANLALILVLNVFVSTVTVFFAPAEAAMIPSVVPRRQLLAANGIFTLTLNAAFALGFALLGPLVVNIWSPEAVILVVAGLYFLAAVFCVTLPTAPPPRNEDVHGLGVVQAELAMSSTFSQLREGLAFIRSNRTIGWSLVYLGITASLVGVLGVLGPDFAQGTLGLAAKDFAVVVLPLGFGVVTGILLLNTYGGYLPRRRVIEGGLIALGASLGALSVSGPISRLLQRTDGPGGFDLSGITSLLAVVVVIALGAGIAYAFVAIPSQTQLSEDLPEDVRGRVFGILNMLVSVASFLPIILVGPIADLVGTTLVLIAVAVVVLVTGVASVVLRGPLGSEAQHAADPHTVDPIAAALGADRPTWREREAPAVADVAPDQAGRPAPTGPTSRKARTAAKVPKASKAQGSPGPSDPADRA
jgi:MFS family permease